LSNINFCSILFFARLFALNNRLHGAYILFLLAESQLVLKKSNSFLYLLPKFKKCN